MKLMALNTTLGFFGPTNGGVAELLSELRWAAGRGHDCSAAFVCGRLTNQTLLLAELGYTVETLSDDLQRTEHAGLPIYMHLVDGTPDTEGISCMFQGLEAPPFSGLVNQVMAAIEMHRPDAVIGGGGDFPVLRACQLAGVPEKASFLRVHEGVLPPRAVSILGALAGGASICTAVSQFVADRLLALGVECDFVAYSRIHGSSHLFKPSQWRPTHVFQVSADGIKGGVVLRGVAERMPEQRFATLEMPPFPGLPANVELWPNTRQMADRYARARIVLLPSLCEEAFGRVACEAAANGIPVVGLRRGGIPEAVGDGGVLLDVDVPDPIPEPYYTDVDLHADLIERFVETVRQLLCDPHLYQELSEKARRHAGVVAARTEEIQDTIYARLEALAAPGRWRQHPDNEARE